MARGGVQVQYLPVFPLLDTGNTNDLQLALYYTEDLEDKAENFPVLIVLSLSHSLTLLFVLTIFHHNPLQPFPNQHHIASSGRGLPSPFLGASYCPLWASMS